MAWSHTQEVKAELSRLPIGSPEAAAAELAGMWAVAGRPTGLRLRSALLARRAYRLARRAGAEPTLDSVRDRGVRLVLGRPEALPAPQAVRNLRAYLRGAFLIRGYVADPERTYHLEIVVGQPQMAARLQARLKAHRIEAQTTMRRGVALLYIKNQDQVGRFLVYLGAYNARLGLESLLVVRAMKNRVNRLVNGEAANLRRTAESGVHQQAVIQQLMQGPEWERLPQSLKDLAVLRLRHPDWNLRELGLALKPPLSKSGVAHRLRRLLRAEGAKGYHAESGSGHPGKGRV
jgi:DNA-binding transcriptional regulator WhiA